RWVRRTRNAWPKAPVGEIRLAARAETLVQRRRHDVRRHRVVDGGLDRPTPKPSACSRSLPSSATRSSCSPRPLDVSPNRSCFLLGTEGANSSLRSTAHILALLQEQTAQ